MGADELFGGYRKHLAMLMAARYLRVPGPIRSLVGPAVRGLPVAVAGRGLRTVRWAHRFLTFAELPEEGIPAQLPSTTETSWRTCSTRRLPSTSTG